jgi:hypothetical protein
MGYIFTCVINSNRLYIMTSRKQFISVLASGTVALPFVKHGISQGISSEKSYFNVTSYGAVGDGNTPSAESFQKAIDEAEASGGGIVFIPAGRFILEKTPLIGTNVHLMGSGCATVLVGERTGDYKGAALISNKGQHVSGYDGAGDWSISHLAIDSPKTNGIVVTHAKNVYISHIYGIEAYHHFIDTAGKNIICENLFLTGHSGTSTFQIDSLGNAQSIWDGQQPVSPNLDGTQTEDLILRNSIITATAGTEGSRPRHDTSIHFHGEVSGGMLFSDLILGGAENGIYMDDGLSYSNVQMTNITSYNPGRAIWFEPSPTRQENISIRGLIHQPEKVSEKLDGYRAISIYGTDKLTLSDIHLKAPAGVACLEAIELDTCTKTEIKGLKADAHEGTAILIRDRRNSENTLSRYIQISGCMMDGFETGIRCVNDNGGGDFYEWGNLFIKVQRHLEGNIKSLTQI